MTGPLFRIMAALAIAGASVAAPLSAAAAQEARPIVDDELADGQLHTVHGDTQVGLDPAGDLDDFDTTQSIAWVQLDNWFSEDGAEIIAANIARESSALVLAGL